MSTIQHRVTHLNLWWYAAAVVLAGAVAALVIATLQNAAVSHNPSIVIEHGPVGHYQPNPHPCFAGRTGGSVELLRSGCSTGR